MVKRRIKVTLLKTFDIREIPIISLQLHHKLASAVHLKSRLSQRQQISDCAGEIIKLKPVFVSPGCCRDPVRSSCIPRPSPLS